MITPKRLKGYHPLLSEDINHALFQIHSYCDDEVVINGKKYQNSLIISPNQLIADWEPRSTHTLQPADLTLIASLSPDVILLGTGKKSVILPPAVLAPLLEKQYNVECMNTAAACRTYAVLSAEGRRVAAGLILETNRSFAL